jgi:hypothetical protein
VRTVSGGQSWHGEDSQAGSDCLSICKMQGGRGALNLKHAAHHHHLRANAHLAVTQLSGL